jgi:hypothetical protein
MATVSSARAGGYGRRGPRRSVVSGLLAKRARRGRHTPTARLPQIGDSTSFLAVYTSFMVECLFTVVFSLCQPK